jgi:thiol:disulfide interchange protein DsbA
VVVRRVPVAFNASFVPQQKLYYALEAWASSTQCTPRCSAPSTWSAKLAKDDAIFDWVGKQGVDLAKFKEVYNSFTVANQARRPRSCKAYGVEGVPAMGVAGRYYTDGTMAGNRPCCKWWMPGGPDPQGLMHR